MAAGPNRARGSTKRATTVAEAKRQVTSAIRNGVSVKDAMAAVDRQAATYEDWRKHDPEFRAAIDGVREVARAARRRGAGAGKTPVPDFPEFCAEYLGQPLPLHHQRVWDVLNGREPREMHPSIQYQVGRPNRLLLNFFPYSAKTTVWSVNYVIWRLVQDPNVRIAVISQTQDFAKKIVHQVNQVLTGGMPQYAKLLAAYMPEGGWVGDGWTKTQIYLKGVDTAQKDPSLQALGLMGQVYGSRLDVILLDDLVTSKNTHTYKELADWIGTEVASRVDEDGVLVCLGTRMGSPDLYSTLRDLTEWDDETPVWTHFAQPAVLEEPTRDPESWVCTWPDKWPGRALAKARAELGSEARWQLTYQQWDSALDQVFPAWAVNASIDHSRASGPAEGLYCVLGVDPAANGFTAMMVMGYDRSTGQRLVLDGHIQARMPPDQFMAKMREFITRHRVREVVGEKNAVQGFIWRQRDFLDFCYANGCLVTEHQTTSAKWDPDLGVSSMSPWFQSCAVFDAERDGYVTRPVPKRLITLPNPKFSTWVDTLVTQLVSWQPREGVRAQKMPTDAVMALWFASLGIQKVVDNAKNIPRHLANSFLPRADLRQRAVVNLDELRRKQLAGENEQSFYQGSPVDHARPLAVG